MWDFVSHFQSHHNGIEICVLIIVSSSRLTSNRTIMELKLNIHKNNNPDNAFQSHHNGIEIPELNYNVAKKAILPIAP